MEIKPPTKRQLKIRDFGRAIGDDMLAINKKIARSGLKEEEIERYLTGVTMFGDKRHTQSIRYSISIIK